MQLIKSDETVYQTASANRRNCCQCIKVTCIQVAVKKPSPELGSIYRTGYMSYALCE